jgi:Domain of unknown function (DUF4055)
MASAEQKFKEDMVNPATTSMAYDYMAPKWAMINTLLGGTAAMRAAGPTYLPPHPHESETNYQERLHTTTLLNMFELTLESLVSKPFSDDMVVENIPKKMEPLLEDIDLKGNEIHVFCRRWFREALAKSFAHVLIDMPTLDAAPGQVRTLKDDADQKVRPYWNLISPENVIFMYESMIDGYPQLEHVRIRENIVERVGFTEQIVQRIRILERGTYRVMQLVKDTKTNKEVWRTVEEGVTGVPFIPLVTFYANVDGEMLGKPPLEDLGYLNVSHWQSMSDQRNILTVARFPMLAVSGARSDGGGNDIMVIGPRQLLATQAENGKFYYVEHDGKAIDAGAKDLDKLEQDMASYGAEFLRKKPGAQTATARALDSAEATSTLQDISIRFEDAVEMALWVTGQWMGEETLDVEVEVVTDYGPEEIKDVDLRTLAEARRNRDISLQTYTAELKRRGALSDDFDYKVNLEQLQTEPTIQSPFATGFNTDGSASSNVDNSMKKGKAKPEDDDEPKGVKVDDAKGT